jgi:hypothetical protein
MRTSTLGKLLLATFFIIAALSTALTLRSRELRIADLEAQASADSATISDLSAELRVAIDRRAADSTTAAVRVQSDTIRQVVTRWARAAAQVDTVRDTVVRVLVRQGDSVVAACRELESRCASALAARDTLEAGLMERLATTRRLLATSDAERERQAHRAARRWGLGIHAGYGVSADTRGRDLRLGPQVGLSLQYRVF